MTTQVTTTVTSTPAVTSDATPESGVASALRSRFSPEALSFMTQVGNLVAQGELTSPKTGRQSYKASQLAQVLKLHNIDVPSVEVLNEVAPVYSRATSKWVETLDSGRDKPINPAFLRRRLAQGA